MNVGELRAKHPFPWHYTVEPNGNILVTDATGRVVPLFTLLDFVVGVTQSIHNRKDQAA
jgi:hypothetical protein